MGSERDRAEEALWRAVFERALDAMLLVKDDRYVEANPAACELFGLEREQLLGCSAEDFAAPGFDIEAERAKLRREGRLRGEFPLRRADGRDRQVEYHTTANLTPGVHLTVVRDITERKRAEEELRISEQRYRRIVETTSELAAIVECSEDAIVGGDLNLCITSWNHGARKLFGYASEEVIGHPISMLAPPDHRHEAAGNVQKLLAGETVDRFDTVRLRKDGSTVEVTVTVSPIRDAAGRVLGIAAILRDQTERRAAERALRRSEDRLRQVQKMEAIGSLAGGVAHDFNNLLSVIIGYSSSVLDALSPGDPLRADLTEVLHAAARGENLTRQLLAFSRKQVLSPRVLDLNETLLGMERMLERLIGEDIALHLLTLPTLGRVLADPGQIEQVVMNLVVNARDAMPAGGKLTLETANVELAEADTRVDSELPPGDYVLFSVADTGTGIDSTIRQRIFEPFFTTKGLGKGTGLGLATVLGIIQQSGGHVVVESAAARGSLFKIYLPRTDARAERTTAAPPPRSCPRGSETILLVEDDEQLRILVRTVLRRNGYHVLEAQNGGEAFLICEQYEPTIELLLTDVVMPRLSGKQLATRLQALRPNLKVLYMSGYTDGAISHHGVLEPGVHFIQKPVTPDALGRKVRAVLDSTDAPTVPNPVTPERR